MPCHPVPVLRRPTRGTPPPTTQPGTVRRVDHDATRRAVTTRTARVRRKSAKTEADKIARQMDTVNMIVSGATLRQCATTFKTSMENVRLDYAAGLERLRDSSIDYSIQLRDEVTARQRSLILANIVRARAGDKTAAIIVNQADQLLASIWGLRYIKIAHIAPTAKDPGITEAIGAYLQGLADSASVPAKP